MTKSLIAVFVVTFSYLNVLSQVKEIYRGEIPAPVKTDESILTGQLNQPPPSKKIIDFQNRMKAAKESDNKDEIIRLQGESDRITGTYTAAPKQTEVKKLTPEQEDNIIMNNITNSTERIVTAMATCTEQSGNKTGRIWSVYRYTPVDGFSDGIGISYSDDYGNNWNGYGLYSIAGIQWLYNDKQMDAELVINSSNEKYLWITFTTIISSISQHNLIDLFIVNLNNGSASNSILNWPGSSFIDLGTPRIVSDNAAYSNAVYMYLAVRFDSLTENSPFIYLKGEKVAVCYNPYTTSPLITYRSSCFMRTINFSNNGYQDYFNCDIAYFRNGGQDSILLVETSLASISAITLGRASIFSFVTTSPLSAYIGTINTSPNKRSGGYIASNGAYNNLMISVINEYSATDHDVEYYHSTNGSRGWSQGFIDYFGSDVKTDAEVVGQRNAPGEFAVAFANVFPSTVKYYQTDSYIWSSVYLNNFSHLINDSIRIPKAGIRLNSGSENCFAVWADITRHGLWSSAGCTGPIQTYAKLNISAAIEGLHDPVFNTLIPDTIRVYLRNNFAPYNVVDSTANILSNLYLNEFIFTKTTYNTPYYIQIKHRNALESWSSAAITFTSYEKSYSYWPQANTFGGNSKKIFENEYISIYGFYSGDVNQDGYIDLNDINSVFNEMSSFTTGYVVTDVTGDNLVDLSDLTITFNNSSSFVSLIRP